MITEQYESHSKFIDVMMEGIEEERIVSKDQKSDFDNKIAEALSNFGIRM